MDHVANLQDGITDEQGQYTKRDQCKTSHIDNTSPSPNITISFLFALWIGIVEVIVFLHVFGEQQQAGRRQDVVLFRHSLSVDIVIVAVRP